MKEWLTALEIAAEQLPDLPGTKRGVNDLVEREGWNQNALRSRARQGRGGGTEYNIALLPSLAQVEYRRRHLRVGSLIQPPAANDAGPALLAPVSDRAARERDARLAVVRLFEGFERGQRLNRTWCLDAFVRRYNARDFTIETWVLDHVEHLSKRSLARWCAEAKRGATGRLAVDRSAARKGKGIIDTAEGGRLRTFVLALLADNQHLSAHHIRALCRSEFGDTITVTVKGAASAIPMPPVRTFQHALKGLREAEKVTLTKIQNPDLFRSTMAPSGRGALRHIDEPNTLWMIDASPVDALCTDGRHTIYVCIDIATRRVILSVWRTPCAAAVGLLLRKAILAWGAPETIKTDNGSDFVATSTKRLFASLGIEMDLSDAYQPQQKGHVERVIGTFQRDCATLLPGFVGHDVADRKAIEARKAFAQRLGVSDEKAFGVQLSGAELQDAADRWAETMYHQHPHEGLRGRSPALAAAQARATIRHVDERALDLLLMPLADGGTRRVTRFGVRVDSRHYMTPSILPGTDVLVRMDTADLGLVYAFAQDGGTFLGVGICPELSGIHPETAVKAIKAAQREIVERGTASIRAEIRRLKSGPSYFERIVAVAAADAPNVVALPKRQEIHSTPAIEAAIAAAEAMAGEHRAVPVDPKVAVEQQRLIAMLQAEEDAALQSRHEARLDARAAEIAQARIAHLPVTVTPLPESPRERYRRFVMLRRRVDAGETVDVTDAVLLGRYEGSAEFRGEAVMHEAYGDEYLAF